MVELSVDLSTLSCGLVAQQGEDSRQHLGEMAHLGKKNTGIWDSQIWDPRYLVPLFLVNFPIEAFKFNR